MPNLSTTYAKLNLRTPVIVASAGITGTVERLQRCEENGAGAVVTKSLFKRKYAELHPLHGLK